MLLVASTVSMLHSLGQLIRVLVLFALVLLLTLLTTRWIAKYQQGQIQGQNLNLRVIETLKVSANGYIQIIEAGDVYLVIAVSKDHIEKLAEITKAQLKAEPALAGQKSDMGESFHDILDKVRKHLPKK